MTFHGTHLPLPIHDNEQNSEQHSFAPPKMSLPARTLAHLFSTVPPLPHPPDLERLLFTTSTAIMDPYQLQQVLQLRDALGPGPIFQMPTELLWKVFGLLSHEDKLSFRLTNKSLCAAVKLPFAQMLPSDWRFEFTEPSLTGLINLTADKCFVAQCRTITFVATRFRTVVKFKDQLDIADNELANQQLKHFAGGHHTRAIYRALDNLQANDKTDVGFIINDEISPQIQAFGIQRRIRRLQRDIHNTISAFDLAVRRNKFPLREIKVETRDFIAPHPGDIFWTHLETAPDFTIIKRSGSRAEVSSVKHKLTLNHAYMLYRNYDDTRYCHRLTVNKELYCCLANRQHREITLHDVHTTHEILPELLNHYNTTHLELRDVMFHTELTSDTTTPIEFLEALERMPRLESLILRGSRSDDGSFEVPRLFIWQSREEIHAGLDRLISRLRGLQ